MWTTETAQIPKGTKLSCTIADFCRISNFAEPEDVLNVGGKYAVSWRWGTANGKPLERTRPFNSKTHADYFIALLQECNGVTVLDGPTFEVELLTPEIDGKHLVNAYGTIEEAVRGTIEAVVL